MLKAELKKLTYLTKNDSTEIKNLLKYRPHQSKEKNENEQKSLLNIIKYSRNQSHFNKGLNFTSTTKGTILKKDFSFSKKINKNKLKSNVSFDCYDNSTSNKGIDLSLSTNTNKINTSSVKYNIVFPNLTPGENTYERRQVSDYKNRNNINSNLVPSSDDFSLNEGRKKRITYEVSEEYKRINKKMLLKWEYENENTFKNTENFTGFTRKNLIEHDSKNKDMCLSQYSHPMLRKIRHIKINESGIKRLLEGEYHPKERSSNDSTIKSINDIRVNDVQSNYKRPVSAVHLKKDLLFN